MKHGLPGRAGRRDAASSALPQEVLAHFLGAPGVAPVALLWGLPASLPRTVHRTPTTKHIMRRALNGRKPDEIRREIELEREQLASAVEDLRDELAVTGKLRAKLPAAAAGSLGTGFVLAGGIGATMRLLARRGREGRTRARFGRFSLVDRD